MTHLPIRKLAFMGVLLSLSLLFGYIEWLLSFTMVIPGAKLGLGNLVALLMIFSKNYKWREIFLFQICRILLSSLLFASLFSLVYSFGGMLFSIFAMYLAKEWLKLAPVATSILGGVFHNIGQVMIAMFLISKYVVLSHLPYLLILGFVAGFCMGILSNLLCKRKLV